MITRPLGYAWLAVAVVAVTVSGQQPATPTFRFERPVVTGGAGPRRLPVDVPLLVGGVPFRVTSPATDPKSGAPVYGLGNGLTDLRLYDSNGAEIGYLFMGYAPPIPEYQAAAILPVATVDTPNEKTSGFEADIGSLMVIDRFRIDGLRPPFLKRVRLEASGDRERWTLLVPQATLFDLPDEKLRELRALRDHDAAIDAAAIRAWRADK